MKSIQELLVQASIEMTMRYAPLSPEVKKDAVEKLDWDANQGHHRGTKEEIGPLKPKKPRDYLGLD